MGPNPINHDPERLIQPHLRIGEGDLSQQAHNLLNRCRQERNERIAVEIPSIALGEAASGGEANCGVGGRVAAEEMDEEGVDLGARGGLEILANPVADEPGYPTTDDAIAGGRRGGGRLEIPQTNGGARERGSLRIGSGCLGDEGVVEPAVKVDGGLEVARAPTERAIDAFLEEKTLHALRCCRVKNDQPKAAPRKSELRSPDACCSNPAMLGPRSSL